MHCWTTPKELEVNRGALLEARLSRTGRVEADQWSKLFCSKE